MKNVLTIAGVILLCGCSTLPSVEQIIATVTNDNTANEQTIPVDPNGVDSFGSVNYTANNANINSAYQTRPLTRHIGDYVSYMAQDLVSNMEYVTEATTVAVTHFSLLDGNLNETNLVGQQMAESFIHEFHKFRMPVVEYKATQIIRVTDQGDFVMSRDFNDLTNTTPIQYVLTGTMTKHQRGYLVNARMLGMRSNIVVASAQSFIPFYIIDALIPSTSERQSEFVDGIKIIKGE